MTSTAAPLPSKKSRPSDPPKELTLTRFTGASIPNAMLARLLALVERNMGGFSGDGWDREQCREETTHSDQQLLLYCSGTTIHAAASCRVCIEESVRVCYLYELQVAEVARGSGLGSKLMDEVERIGREGGAKGIMLTVHASNRRAQHFYTERCGFEISPISPSMCAPPTALPSSDYEIMQRMWDAEAARKLRRRGQEAKQLLWQSALEQGTLRIRLRMRDGAGVTGAAR